MNKIAIAVALLMGAFAIVVLPALGARAADGHRVVLELTSDDAQTWESVLNNIENVRKALPGTAVQVVAHGKGLALLVSAKNAAFGSACRSKPPKASYSPLAKTR